MLAGTGRPLAVASGVAGLKPGRIATERDNPNDHVSPRAASERAALALADRGVRSMSVRFAPTVHGAGDHGFIARIIDADRNHGAAGYVADGGNRWPAVHRSDAARLVRLGIEHAPGGSVLHAVAEEGVPMRDIAAAIGRHFELPATAISPEEAGARFGFIGQFIGLDMPASSALTRELLGWEPTGPASSRTSRPVPTPTAPWLSPVTAQARALTIQVDAGAITPSGPANSAIPSRIAWRIGS